jgi:hypothetical protein
MTHEEAKSSWFGETVAPLIPGSHWLHGAQEKRRFCALRGGRLWYFAEKPDALLMDEVVDASEGVQEGLEVAAASAKKDAWENAARGYIELSTVQEARLGSNGEFLLRTSSRTFTLRAEDEEESAQWLRCIQSCVTAMRASMIGASLGDDAAAAAKGETGKGEAPETSDAPASGSAGRVVPGQEEEDLDRRENKRELQTTVGYGDMYVVEVPVDGPGAVLSWHFSTDRHDISFGVKFKRAQFARLPDQVMSGSEPEPETDEILWPNMRVKSHICAQRGMLLSPGPGCFSLVWDNSYSRIRSKTLRYRFVLSSARDRLARARLPVGDSNDASIGASSHSSKCTGQEELGMALSSVSSALPSPIVAKMSSAINLVGGYFSGATETNEDDEA